MFWSWILLNDMRAAASSPACGDYAAVLAAIKDAARRASAVAFGHP